MKKFLVEAIIADSLIGMELFKRGDSSYAAKLTFVYEANAAHEEDLGQVLKDIDSKANCIAISRYGERAYFSVIQVEELVPEELTVTASHRMKK